MNLIKYFCKYIRSFFIGQTYKLYIYNNILFQRTGGGFTSLQLSTVIIEALWAGEDISAGTGHEIPSGLP